VTVTLGLGAAIAPDYFGAGTTSVGPTGVFAVRELVLPGGFGIGSDSALPTDPGFGARGAFRFVSTRAASENSELQGLDDIDFAVELGAGPVRCPRRPPPDGAVLAQLRGIGPKRGGITRRREARS
jgi:hypothetical protein